MIGTWTPGLRLTCLLILVILPPSFPSPPTAASLSATVPHSLSHMSGTLLFLLIPGLCLCLTYVCHLILFRTIFPSLLTRENPVTVEFDELGFCVKDARTRMVLHRYDSPDELYPVHSPSSTTTAPVALSAGVDLWHARLGHPNPVTLRHILRSFSFSCNKIEDHTCHACRVGKHVRLPFNNSTTIASFPFQLIHSDVWTSPVPSNSGYLYYLVILDDYSHYVWTFPLRGKSDALSTLTAFYSYVSTQFGRPILALQTDNGKEFDNLAFRTFLSHHGTIFHLTCPHTS